MTLHKKLLVIGLSLGVFIGGATTAAWSQVDPSSPAPGTMGSQNCGGPGTGPTNPCGASAPASNSSNASINVGAGNPINILSGNKYQREEDMPPLPGVLGLEIVRHYNSLYSQPGVPNGIMGRGWRLSYETELHVTGRALQLTQADGARVIFSRDPFDPSLCATADPADGMIRIRKTARGNEYTWSWANGRKLDFNSDGKLVQILAPSGEFVTLQYDVRGMLQKVTDPQGRSLQLRYLDKTAVVRGGRFTGVVAIDSPVGQFRYEYGSEMPKGATLDKVHVVANLVKVSVPTHYDSQHMLHAYTERGITSSSIARIYHYEDALHPTLLTGITVTGSGSDGKLMNQRIGTYGYNANGLAILTVKGGLARFATDRDGKVLQPARPVAGTGIEQVTLDYSEPGQTTITDNLGQQTVYKHAIIGGRQRLLEVRGPGCASCGQTNVRYGYDRLGRLTDITNLNTAGQPVQATKRELDYFGRILNVNRVSYRNGKPEPAQWLVRYEYRDDNPQPTLIARPSVVRGKEYRTAISYNDHGQPVKVSENGWMPAVGGKGESMPLARTTTYKYQNINGKIVLAEIDGPLKNGLAEGPQDSDVTRYNWNPRGDQIVAITRPMGRVTKLRYDENSGRLAAVIHQWDGVARQTRYKYAPGGQVQEQVEEVLAGDAEAVQAKRITAFKYNVREQVAQIVWPDQASTVPDYDSEGRMRSIAVPNGPTYSSQAPSNVEQRVGGEIDLSASLKAYYGESGSVAGGEVLKFDADKKTAQRQIDDFGRVVAVRNPGQEWQYAHYDAADRLVEIVDPRDARTVIEYDLAGRLLRAQREMPDHSAKEIIQLAWRAALKVEETVLSEGKALHTTRYEYNPWGQLTRREVEIASANVAAQPVRMTLQYQYDDAGKLVAQILPSGERLAYRYYAKPPAQSQLAAIEHVRWPHWLDPVMTMLPDGWQIKTRLAEFAPRTSNERAVPRGRRDRQADQQLAPEVEPGLSDQAPGADFDQAGFPHRLANRQGTFTLSWNAGGRLVSVRDGTNDDFVARYTYDAQGRRASKTTATGSEYYLYAGTQLIAVAAQLGNQIHIRSEYVYEGYRALAWIKDKTPYLLQTDHRGATRAVTRAEEQPKVLWQGAMDTWGLVFAPSANQDFDPKLRLLNQYADVETGLSYHVARYYDPSQGRFISPDPQGVVDSIDRQTPEQLKLDLTAYAAGQPQAFFDPDGAAKLTYYAITTGANGQALGANQGFTKARWAFTIEDVRESGQGGSEAINQLMQTYAQNGTGLLFDGGGNFLSPGQKSTSWSGGDSVIIDMFKEHYGANLISISQFTIDFSDRDAALLIASLTNNTRDLGFCPNATALLPDIQFAAEESDIQPGFADSAKLQRIIACGAGSDANLNQRRIAKYEAAAELNETSRPKQINKDCSRDGCPGVFYSCNATQCRGTASAPGTGVSYVASYGRSQFIGATMVSELISAFNRFTSAERTALAMDANSLTDLQAARTRGANLLTWFNSRIAAAQTYADASAAWDNLSAAQRSQFTADTGLGEQAYEDIVRLKTSPPTNSNGTSLLGDARQAMVTAAIMSDPTMSRLLTGIFSDFDRFTVVGLGLMRNNLDRVLRAYPNADEEEIAARVARLHNGGNWNAPLATLKGAGDSFNYVKRFLGDQRGEGEFRSLRCTQDFGPTVRTVAPGTNGQGIGGIELTPIKFN